MLLEILSTSRLEKLLLGEQEWTFAPEIILRTLIMYLIVLLSLRTLGKRGVKQLSVFEMVVIISLGSAAGDPMFYKEVGILSALIVFIVVVIAYKFTAYLVGKSEKIENILEGTCTCLIEHGMFSIQNFKKESMAQDEFFSELRLKSISHLGQVELAIIETSGSISLFYYPDDKIKYGLPILPSLYEQKVVEIKYKDYYSCSFCGNTQLLAAQSKHECERCTRKIWVKSIINKRIT